MIVYSLSLSLSRSLSRWVSLGFSNRWHAQKVKQMPQQAAEAAEVSWPSGSGHEFAGPGEGGGWL